MNASAREGKNVTQVTNEEFAKLAMLMARPAEQFRPTATYDPDGDCIEFVAKPDPFYAERLDDLITVYYSEETKEVIGSLVKGVSRFCAEFSKKNPGFKIVIEDGPVRLEYLFLAKLWSSQHGPRTVKTLVYRKLIQVAGETVVEGKLLCA